MGRHRQVVRHGFAKPASPVRIRVPPPIIRIIRESHRTRCGSLFLFPARSNPTLARSLARSLCSVSTPSICADTAPPRFSLASSEARESAAALSLFPNRPFHQCQEYKRPDWSELSPPSDGRDRIAPSHLGPQDTIIVSTRLKRSRQQRIARGGNRACR